MKRFIFAGVLFAGVRFVLGSAGPIFWEPLGEPGGGGRIVSVAVSPHDPKHLVAAGDMLGTGVSRDGGESWQPGLGFMTYEMASVTFHPKRTNEVWVGSCSGPYVSADGGRTWTSRRQGMPEPAHWKYTAIVEKVLFDPANPKRMLAFGGTSRGWNPCDCFGWIWRSDDEGLTWSHVGTVTADGFTSEKRKGENIVKACWGEEYGGRTVHLLTVSGAWWESLDGGDSWQRRQPQGLTGRLTGLAFHPAHAKIVWAATHNAKDASGSRVPGGVFKSTDGGRSFVASDAGIEKVRSGGENHVSGYLDVVVSPAAPDELYTSDQSWSKPVVWRSRDGGASWRRCEGKAATACFAGPSVQLAVAPTRRGHVYGWNTEYILRTTDGGRTWDDATARQTDPVRPELWRGRGWNGWCATDFVFNPYRKGQSLALAMDAGHGWLSDDGLKSWRYTRGETHPWMGGVAAAFSKDGFIYITTGQFGNGNGIACSRDGGKSWTTLAGKARGLPEAGWNTGRPYGGVYVNPENGRQAWVACNGELLRTADGGETWTANGDGLTGVNHLAGDPTRTNHFFVKAKGGVYETCDGRTFRSLGLPRVEDQGRINCDARGRVLVCLWRTEKDGGLWRYDPATQAWTHLLDEPLAREANADPTDPTRLLLVTAQDPFNDFAGGAGVWISADDGASWSPANDGLPMLRAHACAFDPFDPELVVVGQNGGGFMKARWPKDFRPKGTRRVVKGTHDK